jgi:hypothetical protein
MGIIKTHFIQAKDLTINNVFGKITADEIFASTQKSLADNPTSRVLWNFMEADGEDITSKDCRSLYSQISRLPNIRTNKKIALVASRVIGYGLCRMFAIYAGQEGISAKFNFFLNLEEAMQWLEEPLE